MDHLAAAATALSRSQLDAALEHLIAAWREHHRHPELAGLVERLAAAIAPAIEPLDLTRRPASHGRGRL
jgi:hypothetical protein